MTGQELLDIIKIHYDNKKRWRSSDSIVKAKKFLKGKEKIKLDTPTLWLEFINCFKDAFSQNNQLTQSTLSVILKESKCGVSLEACRYFFDRVANNDPHATNDFLCGLRGSLDTYFCMPEASLSDRIKRLNELKDLSIIVEIDFDKETYLNSMKENYSNAVISEMLKNAIMLIKALALGNALTRDIFKELLAVQRTHFLQRDQGLHAELVLDAQAFQFLCTQRYLLEGLRYNSIEIGAKAPIIDGQKIKNYDALRLWLGEDVHVQRVMSECCQDTFLIENVHLIIAKIENRQKASFEKKEVFLKYLQAFWKTFVNFEAVKEEFKQSILEQVNVLWSKDINFAKYCEFLFKRAQLLPESYFLKDLAFWQAHMQRLVGCEVVPLEQVTFFINKLPFSQQHSSWFQACLAQSAEKAGYQACIEAFEKSAEEYLKTHDCDLENVDTRYSEKYRTVRNLLGDTREPRPPTREVKEKSPEWIMLEVIVSCQKELEVIVSCQKELAKTSPDSARVSQSSETTLSQHLKSLLQRFREAPKNTFFDKKTLSDTLAESLSYMDKSSVKSKLEKALQVYNKSFATENSDMRVKFFSAVTPHSRPPELGIGYAATSDQKTHGW